MEGMIMIIHVNFKVDGEEDPELANWLNSLKKKDRVKSFHIRQALKSYLSGVGVVPVISVNPGNRPAPDLVIETGDILTERQGVNESDLLAKLDSLF
jgi:hypothetical protein